MTVMDDYTDHKPWFIFIGSMLLLLSACQTDGYMGSVCEDKNLAKGSPKYQACVNAEAKRNRYEVNKYRDGGP